MAQGTIKKLISDKGFGFIEGEGGEFFLGMCGLRCSGQNGTCTVFQNLFAALPSAGQVS